MIIWELWVNYTQSRYGDGGTSIARIIYKVTKGMAECIARKWPCWDPFPLNWNAMLKRVEGFGVQKVLRMDSWCKPGSGWVKINMATSARNETAAFLIRNSEGQVCLAGAYTERQGGTLRSLRAQMVRDIWDWCDRKGLERVMFEFDNNQWLSMVPNPERGEVKCSVCTARVNCLARCLANRAEGEDVIWIGGALPRGFQNLVALEGIPHFSYLPGCDLS